MGICLNGQAHLLRKHENPSSKLGMAINACKPQIWETETEDAESSLAGRPASLADMASSCLDEKACLEEDTCHPGLVSTWCVQSHKYMQHTLKSKRRKGEKNYIQPFSFLSVL